MKKLPVTFLGVILSFFIPFVAYAGTSMSAAPSNSGAYGTSFNPTVTCDANYPMMWAFYRVDTGARVGTDAESDITGLNCNGALTSMLGTSMDTIFGNVNATVRALYFDSNSESNCLSGSHDLAGCQADTAYTGQGSHSFDFILTASGGGGGGGSGTTTVSTTTSSIEQTQTNLWYAYWTYFMTFMGTVWLLRPNKRT